MTFTRSILFFLHKNTYIRDIMIIRAYIQLLISLFALLAADDEENKHSIILFVILERHITGSFYVHDY